MVFYSFKELVNLVFTKSELVPLFATIAWSVWFYRNKICLSENARPMGQIVGFVQDYVRDFKSLECCTPTVRIAAPKVWSPPNCNKWKINFDGAMYCESTEAGVGVIVRNSFDKVKAALVEKIRMPSSMEALELLVAKRATLFSQELGLDRVIFERDSEQVMKAVRF